MATDLDANAGLPSHLLVKYRRPRAVRPEDCPLLCVWLQDKTTNPQTTERFDSVLVVGISWQVEAVQEAVTLVEDDAVAEALIDALERIEERIRVWSREGVGVLEAWQITPSGAEYLPANLQQGLVEGYAVGVRVEVTES